MPAIQHPLTVTTARIFGRAWRPLSRFPAAAGAAARAGGGFGGVIVFVWAASAALSGVWPAINEAFGARSSRGTISKHGGLHRRSIHDAAAALSIPVGFYITSICGILFGTLFPAGRGASVGAKPRRDLHLFLIARARSLIPGAPGGPLAGTLAHDFVPRLPSFCFSPAGARSVRSGWGQALLLFVVFWWRRWAGWRFATFCRGYRRSRHQSRRHHLRLRGALFDKKRSSLLAAQAAYHALCAAAPSDCRCNAHLHAAVTP